MLARLVILLWGEPPLDLQTPWDHPCYYPFYVSLLYTICIEGWSSIYTVIRPITLWRNLWNSQSCIADPPEKPEIQGYIDGETIRMGQAVTLVCESYGGNPLAAIVWYKNNQRIDHSYTTSGSKSKNTIMFLAQPDDNNAAYRCEAKNTMIREPLTAQIVMSVQCK